MLCREIVNTDYRSIDISESPESVLAYMNKNQLSIVPIVDNQDYKGLLSIESLVFQDSVQSWEDMLPELHPLVAFDDEHIFRALRLMADQHIISIAVLTKERGYLGMITPKVLEPAVATLLGLNAAPGGCLTLEMNRTSYSFGELARLVETNDADIVQLNTYQEQGTGLFIVNMKVSRKDISDIVATLQRYGYNIRYYFGEELYENDLKRNYDALINYLNI